MSKAAKSRVDEIANHFRVQKRKRDADDEDREGCKKSKYDPWRKVLKLRALALPDLIYRHIQAHGADPKSVEEFLRYNVGSGIGKMVDPNSGLDTKEEKFEACFAYTTELECEDEKDTFRRVFMYLAWHDFTTTVLRPETTGRWSDNMKAEFAAVVKPSAERMEGRQDVDNVVRSVEKWSKRGKKLKQLADQLDAGCLFFLGSVLTPTL